MNKSKYNFIINSLMFVCLTAMIGIGLLIKYILLPGKERWIVYGDNVDLYFLGLDRHEWGTIHLIIGYVLIGLLILHIILHWKMILTLYSKLIKNKSARKVTTIVLIIVCMFLVTFPFLIHPDIQELGRNQKHNVALQGNFEKQKINSEHQNYDLNNGSDKKHHHTKTSIEVKGYMKLSEVASKYNIPCSYLKKNLGIPSSTSEDQKLGWLRKKYDFKMSEVELIIDRYKKSD